MEKGIGGTANNWSNLFVNPIKHFGYLRIGGLAVTGGGPLSQIQTAATSEEGKPPVFVDGTWDPFSTANLKPS